MKEKWQEIKAWMKEMFTIEGVQEGVWAMLFSFFTTFAIVSMLAGEWYNRMDVYSQQIVGLTTFSGYPKQADMTVIRFILPCLVVLFLVGIFIIQLWKKYVRTDKRVNIIFVVGYVCMLAGVFAGKENVNEIATVLIGAILLAIALNWNHISKTETYVNLVLIWIFLEYSMFGLETVLSMAHDRIHLLIQQIYPGIRIGIFLIVLCLAWYVRNHPMESSLPKIMFVSQLLIPLCMTGFYRFEYLYEKTAGEIQLFYSGRWKYFCLFCVGFMFLYMGYRAFRKKGGILLTSVIMISMVRVYSLPEPMLNIDYFHNGEITVPMQQLTSYGKLPYVDLVPIHGMCDYFYGIINTLFFDGTYLALNSSFVVGNLFMAGFLAWVVYHFVEKKGIALLMVHLFAPFFIITAGMRYLFLFAMFFVLFSNKARKKAVSYLWYWVMVSILAIGWNPSIGGSGALSFLPVVLYRLFKYGAEEGRSLIKPEGEEEKKTALHWRIRYGIMLVTGICFIPLFLQILVYLKENTGTTLQTNGMAVISNLTMITDYFVPGVITETGGFFLQTFSLVIPILICIAYALGDKAKEGRTEALECAVVLFLCAYVISSYAFVRYDNGLRTGVVGVFFMIAAGLYLWNEGFNINHDDRKMLPAVIVTMLAIYLTDTSFFLAKEQIVPVGEVKAEAEIEIGGQNVTDPVLYVSGESVGIKNLGTGFISGNALNSLKNINEVLLKTVGEKGSYLDLTNAVANYVIFDKEAVLRYTSGYNISNDLMQTKAIEALEEKNPSLILLEPFIKFDDATLSLRSMKLYQAIVNLGYEPYVYGNVLYMVKGIAPAEGSCDGKEAFAASQHKEAMMFLPAVWGESGLTEKLSEVFSDAETEVCEDGIYVRFNKAVSGKDISYISISKKSVSEGNAETAKEEQVSLLKTLSQMDVLLKGRQTDGDAEQNEVDLANIPHLTVSFESSVGDGVKTHYMNACLYQDAYLIPVGSSPYWMMEEEISQIKVQFSEGARQAKELEGVDVKFYE